MSRPLPQEIQDMSENETVCKFCGVSYLVFHEMKKLEKRVKELEAELSKYVQDAKDAPVLKAQIEKEKKQADGYRSALDDSKTAFEECERRWKDMYQMQGKNLETDRQRQLNDLKHQHTQQVQELRTQVTKAQAERDDARANLTKVSNRVKEVQTALTLQKAYQRGLKNDVQQRTQEFLSDLGKCQVSLTSLTGELEVEKTRATEATVRADRAEEQRDNLSEDLISLRKELASVQQDLSAARSQSSSLQSQLEKARADALEGVASADKATAERIKSLQDDHDRRVTEVEEMRATENKASAMEIDNLKFTVSELTSRVRAKEDELKGIDGAKDAAQKEASVLKDRIAKQVNEIQVLKDKIAALQKELDKGEKASMAVAAMEQQMEQQSKKFGEDRAAIAAEHKKQISDLHEEGLRKAEAARKEALAEMEKSKNMHTSATFALESRVSELEQALAGATAKNREIDAAKNEASIADDRAKRALSQLDAAQAKQKETQAKLDTAQRELSSLKQQHESADSKLSEMKASLEREKARASGFEQELDKMRKEASDRDRELIEQMEGHVASLADKLQLREHEVQSLKQTVQNECQERMELQETIVHLRQAIQEQQLARQAAQSAHQTASGAPKRSGKTGGGTGRLPRLNPRR